MFDERLTLQGINYTYNEELKKYIASEVHLEDYEWRLQVLQGLQSRVERIKTDVKRFEKFINNYIVPNDIPANYMIERSLEHYADSISEFMKDANKLSERISKMKRNSTTFEYPTYDEVLLLEKDEYLFEMKSALNLFYYSLNRSELSEAYNMYKADLEGAFYLHLSRLDQKSYDNYEGDYREAGNTSLYYFDDGIDQINGLEKCSKNSPQKLKEWFADSKKEIKALCEFYKNCANKYKDDFKESFNELRQITDEELQNMNEKMITINNSNILLPAEKKKYIDKCEKIKHELAKCKKIVSERAKDGVIDAVNSGRYVYNDRIGSLTSGSLGKDLYSSILRLRRIYSLKNDLDNELFNDKVLINSYIYRQVSGEYNNKINTYERMTPVEKHLDKKIDRQYGLM